MTDLRKAAEMALESMEAAIKAGDWVVDGACDPDMALVALRQALAPKELPRPDEPIWVVDEKGNKQLLAKQNRAPPKREWVGLTDDEVFEFADTNLYEGGKNYGILSFGKAIEAKLKQKNNG